MLDRLLVAIVGLVGLGVAAPLAAQPDGLEHAVDAYLQPLLRTNNFSGVVLVAKGDEILLEKGYGKASIEHDRGNSPATVFQIASVSKPFTSAAILLLAEQGKLDLSAPLSDVLPDYPGGRTLTIHHLLTHTSGIPNINDFDEYAEQQRRPQTPASLVALFKNRPLEFAPGSRYSYSNSNYNLLAHIIEKVSGETYGAFLDRAIFGPLKLQHSSHAASSSEIIPNLASGYAPKGAIGLQRADYIDWSAKTGNGSLRATARDIQRFIRAVHGNALLKPASVARAFTEHTPNVGYGWFITKTNGRAIHHANGRSPGFSAQADHYLADDVTVVVLSNTYVSVTTPIARAVGALHFGLKPEAMPALRADPPSAKAVEQLVGIYQFGADYYVPNAKIEVRRAGGHVEAVIEGTSYAMIPIDDRRFLLRSFWIPADFSAGDGPANEMRIGEFRGRRLP